MAEADGTEYTPLDFLSSLRNAPKRPLFKHPSLHTDLQELQMALSTPRAAHSQPVIPGQLDPDLTKKFILSALGRYQSEGEVEKKWEGFMQSVAEPAKFDNFLREMGEEGRGKAEGTTANPEQGQQGQEHKQRRQGGGERSWSVERRRGKEKEAPVEQRVRVKIREDVLVLRDIVLAGERVIRSHSPPQ